MSVDSTLTYGCRSESNWAATVFLTLIPLLDAESCISILALLGCRNDSDVEFKLQRRRYETYRRTIFCISFSRQLFVDSDWWIQVLFPLHGELYCDCVYRIISLRVGSGPTE